MGRHRELWIEMARGTAMGVAGMARKPKAPAKVKLKTAEDYRHGETLASRPEIGAAPASW